MTTRTIPAAPEMETALLGSMMLSPAACEHALDVVTAADLYVPRHARIFDAIARLYAAGAAVDPLTVAHELAADLPSVGGRQALLEIQASCPASANHQQYALVVRSLAAKRHVLAYAAELADAAYAADDATISRLLRESGTHDVMPFGHITPGFDVLELVDVDAHYDWLIPGLLERRDKVIITGAEGGGKSTLLRQFGALCACALHPFDRTPLEAPIRVLHVDMENTDNQAARGYHRILHGPTEIHENYTPGTLTVVFRRQGANLAATRDQRWLEALVAHHRPQLLIIGPLYKAFASTGGASKQSEEVAEATAFALDRISVRYECALMLEGHAPHGDGDRDGLRPRGSSLWKGWPEFGIGLAAEKQGGGWTLIRWRGDRDQGRAWPARLVRGKAVPFEVPFEARPENLKF